MYFKKQMYKSNRRMQLLDLNFLMILKSIQEKKLKMWQITW